MFNKWELYETLMNGKKRNGTLQMYYLQTPLSFLD